jgi:beta-lactamase regulating signal transducer with metallopeptidase domain/protocatechuate 3,4-dioxygenase beta subunit
MGNGLAEMTRDVCGVGLTWLAQSSVLLALGLLAGRLLRRFGPAVQSGVYRTTLAAVLICPFASLFLGAAGFDGLSLRLATPATPRTPELVLSPAANALASDVQAEAEANVSDPALSDGERAGGPLSSAPTDRLAGTKRAPEPAAAPAYTAPSLSSAELSAIGVAVWLLGAAFMALRLCVGQARMRRLRASAVPAEATAQALCHEVARQLSVLTPTVWRSPFLFSPCLDGIRRPAILLPDDVGKNLRETFIHELAHLARRDGLWNLLRRWTTAGLWLQPLVWLLSRRIEVAAEEVCDDYVVHLGAERTGYAGHLIELAGRALPPVAPASVGMVSLRSMLAQRIVRILDTSRALSTRAGARAVLAMVAVGLAGTLLAGLLGIDAKRTAVAAGPTAAASEKTIRGQVVGPDGKPVSGATVIAWRYRRAPNSIDDDHVTRLVEALERRRTSGNGRYEFAFGTRELAAGARLIATAPGFGLGVPRKDQQIRLTAGDLPIDGRLVDLEGRPVAGVKVSLGQVLLPQAGANEPPASPRNAGAPVMKLRAPSPAHAAPGNPVSMVGRLILDAEGLLPDGVMTDADGRFRITGLGRDVLANLTLSGPTIATKQVRVLTRAMERFNEEPRDPAFQGLGELAIHGARCVIAVEPTRPIEGFVRDAETKQPIPGAIVTAAALSGSELTIDGLISTETDADGHYRLVGLPKEGSTGHKLAVYPPLDRPYFATRRIVGPARPGFDALRFDVALKSGTWISGKVTDAATGKPVAAAVDYFPLLTNAHAKDYPNFDPDVTASVGIKSRCKTDKEGRFRIVGLPGEGVVTAHTDDQSYKGAVGAESIKGRTDQDQLLTYDRIFPKLYQSLKQVTVKEAATSFTCDLVVDHGNSVLLRIVDLAGAPVTNTAVWGRNPEGTDHGDHNLYNESTARISGLEHGKPRTVLIKQLNRNIGAVLTIPSGGLKTGAQLTVELRPSATLTGRLVDSAGKPVSGGVRVELTAEGATLFEQIPAASAELDSDGRFHCENLPPGRRYQVSAANNIVYGLGRRMEPETFKPFMLARDLELKPGQTLDFGTIDVNTGQRVKNAEPSTSTRGDVPITGRIIDLEGRPVVGALVKAGRMLTPKSADLGPWLDGVKKGEPPWVAYRHADHDSKPAENATRQATTDKDGRFRLDGFGADRVVSLEFKGAQIAHASIEVATRKMAPFPAAGFANLYGPGKQTIYGADFTYTAAPGRPIEGRVKDVKTGQPLADVEIRSYRFAGSDFVGIMNLKTRTDTDGRFRLEGMPKGKANKVILVPNDEQPYFMQEIDIADPPGAGPVSVEIALLPGVWIEGKLTEKATGKPVPEAWLHYLPFLANKFAEQHPVFDRNGNTNGVGFQQRYTTKSDGTFKLVGLPGRAIVGVVVNDKKYLQGAGSESIEGMNQHGHFETYRNPINPGRLWPTVMKEIDPPADAKVVHVDLQVTTGPSVRITAVDPEGKPISGLNTRGRSGRSSYDRDTMAKPEAEVANLMLDEQRIVLLHHEGRRLGKAVTVKKGDDTGGPVVVKLAPLATISGRVLDGDGNPIGGATVRPDVLPSGDFSMSLPQVVTDENGRFRVQDVPTGCDYALAVETNAPISGRQFAFHPRAAVKPGETADVGDIKFKND